jgi:hypothetical protein
LAAPEEQVQREPLGRQELWVLPALQGQPVKRAQRVLPGSLALREQQDPQAEWELLARPVEQALLDLPDLPEQQALRAPQELLAPRVRQGQQVFSVRQALRVVLAVLDLQAPQELLGPQDLSEWPGRPDLLGVPAQPVQPVLLVLPDLLGQPAQPVLPAPRGLRE